MDLWLEAGTKPKSLMTALMRHIARRNIRSGYNQLGLDRNPRNKELTKNEKPFPTKKKVSKEFIQLISDCVTSHSSTKKTSAAANTDFWANWSKTMDLIADTGADKRKKIGEIRKRHNSKFKFLQHSVFDFLK